MNRKNIKYVLVVLISVVIIPGLFSSPPAFGDTSPSIEEVIRVELGTVTSNYYHIKSNTFDTLYSSAGKLKLSYSTEALLEVNVSTADQGIDLSDLEISLLPSDSDSWKDFGGVTPIELKTVTSTNQTTDFVQYKLRYLPDGNERPGNYSFRLNFELIQVGLVIRVIGGTPGPGNKVNLKVSDHNGPVGNTTIKVNGENAGITNPSGVLNNFTFPDEEEVTITATHDGRETTRVFNFEEYDEGNDKGKGNDK